MKNLRSRIRCGQLTFVVLASKCNHIILISISNECEVFTNDLPCSTYISANVLLK